MGYSVAVSVALGVIIARMLGPSLFGTYSVLVTFGAMVLILQDGGFKTLLYRESVHPTDRHLANVPNVYAVALGHVVKISLLVLLVCLALSKPFSYIVTTVCFAGFAVVQFSSAMLRGEGRFGVEALWQVGYRTATILLLLGLLLNGFRQPWQIICALGIVYIVFCFYFVRCRKFKITLKFDGGYYRAVLPILCIDILVVIYFRCDILLMEFYGFRPADIGSYTAAFKIIEAFNLIVAPVMIVFFGWVRKQAHDGLVITRALIGQCSLAVVLSILILLSLLNYSSEILNFVFGQIYFPAAKFLNILAWAIPFLFVNALLMQIALAFNGQTVLAIIVAITAIFNLGCNFVFLPNYGPAAASLVTVLTEILLSFLLFLWFATKKKFVLPLRKTE